MSKPSDPNSKTTPTPATPPASHPGAGDAASTSRGDAGAPARSGSGASTPAEEASGKRGVPTFLSKANERRSRNVGWRSRDVLRAAALVVGFLVAVRLLWFAHLLVLTAFLGILFGLAVTAGVDYLQRWRIPRGVAAALIVFGTLGLLGGFFAWSAPTLREQSRELRTKLPEAIDKLERWVEQRQGGVIGTLLGATVASGQIGQTRPAGDTGAKKRASPPSAAPATASDTTTPAAASDTGAAADNAADSAVDQRTAEVAAQTAARTAARMSAQQSPPPANDSQEGARGGLRERVLSGASGAARYLFPFLSSTFAVLGGLLLIVFLAIYVAAEPDTYHDGLMHLFPHHFRKRAGEVLSAIAAGLRRWLVTQLIAMVTIGTVTTIVLLLLGVKAALPLGILAGLLEFVPTLGPFLSAVPAIAMGFVDSPQKALWVGLAYVGIQFAENHLLIPILMKQGVNVPPALTILAQALMALVFGFLGLLVAVPLLVAVMVAVKMLYVEGVVGEPVEVFEGEGDDDD